MLRGTSHRDIHGQLNLIGMLVSVAIIVTLMAVFVPPMLSTHSGKGEARTPMEQAYGAGCSEYTGQMNMAVTMYKGDHEGHPPRTLDDLKPYGVKDAIIHAKGCYYQIDPATGAVSEVAHGHTADPGTSYPVPTAPAASPDTQPAPVDNSGGRPAPPAPEPSNNPNNIHIPNMSPNVSGF